MLPLNCRYVVRRDMHYFDIAHVCATHPNVHMQKRMRRFREREHALDSSRSKRGKVQGRADSAAVLHVRLREQTPPAGHIPEGSMLVRSYMTRMLDSESSPHTPNTQRLASRLRWHILLRSGSCPWRNRCLIAEKSSVLVIGGMPVDSSGMACWEIPHTSLLPSSSNPAGRLGELLPEKF